MQAGLSVLAASAGVVNLWNGAWLTAVGALLLAFVYAQTAAGEARDPSPVVGARAAASREWAYEMRFVYAFAVVALSLATVAWLGVVEPGAGDFSVVALIIGWLAAGLWRRGMFTEVDEKPDAGWSSRKDDRLRRPRDLE